MSDGKDHADMDREFSKNEAILSLLAEHPEGLSAHRIVKLLGERDEPVVIRGTGQALGRLRTLARRDRVVAVDGERPGTKVWKLA